MEVIIAGVIILILLGVGGYQLLQPTPVSQGIIRIAAADVKYIGRLRMVKLRNYCSEHNIAMVIVY